MDKDCADFAEIITYSSLQKETGMSRAQLLLNYTINLWEKSNAKGKGKVVGEINPGAHALVLKSGKDSYKIFIPNGIDKTYAQMTSKAKNKISHRSIAIKKLNRFLEKTI